MTLKLRAALLVASEINYSKLKQRWNISVVQRTVELPRYLWMSVIWLCSLMGYKLLSCQESVGKLLRVCLLWASLPVGSGGYSACMRAIILLFPVNCLLSSKLLDTWFLQDLYSFASVAGKCSADPKCIGSLVLTEGASIWSLFLLEIKLKALK